MSYSNNTSTEDQIVSENGQTLPVFSLVNTIGNVSYFVTTASPEGVITADIGDLAVDISNGAFYIKKTTSGTNTSWYNFTSSSSSGWSLTGNAGTTAGTNFMGTTDGQDVVIKRASIESGRISDSLQSTSFGILSLALNTAIRNTAIGYNALPVNISGNSNTAVGRSALATNTANGNTAVGSNALTTNSTGTDNIAIGKSAFQMNDTGSSNTIIGTSTGNDLASGDYNTIIGANVSGLNSTDSSQVIISEGQGNIRFWAKSDGSTAVGTGTLASPTTGAGFDVQGTAGGLRHPRLTTAQRTALANLSGNVVYDTTLSSLYVNNGATWSAVGGGTSKYYVQQVLTSGNNTITHNLALATPKALHIEVRDDTTGQLITTTALSHATNSVVLNVVTTTGTANITIIG